MIATSTLIFLAGAGFGAGLVDAIAGGGGLLTVPALLATGMPVYLVLGTNKAQSSVGTTVATWRYARGGLVDWRVLWPSILASGVGAAGGVWLVHRIALDALKLAIPVLMLAAILYFLLSPRMTDAESQSRISLRLFPPIAGLIGFYDGFFGPGTGSFCAAALVGLVGMGLSRATGNTKALNLTSNTVSVILFIAAGQVAWMIAIVMGLCNIFGAWIGTHMALKHGARVIRPLLIIVSLALTLKMLLDPANPIRGLLVR